MTDHQAVLFDLDGTLLDTIGDIADSMNAVLAGGGYPQHDLQAYKRFVGDGIQALVERALPGDHRSEAEISDGLARMGEEYQRRWNQKSRPYPGIAELLAALEQRGIPKAVFSNKPHRFAVACVDELLKPWKFDAVLGVSATTPRKPDPTGALRIAEQLSIEPAGFVYVGDTNTDMRTAAAAGMDRVGVSWGFRETAELLRSGAQRILMQPLDLLREF